MPVGRDRKITVSDALSIIKSPPLIHNCLSNSSLIAENKKGFLDHQGGEKGGNQCNQTERRRLCASPGDFARQSICYNCPLKAAGILEGTAESWSNVQVNHMSSSLQGERCCVIIREEWSHVIITVGISGLCVRVRITERGFAFPLKTGGKNLIKLHFNKCDTCKCSVK